MPLFHFHLRAGGSFHRDLMGHECPDSIAAQAYAATVARELMRNADQKAQNWSICVEDCLGKSQFELLFRGC
jgi:uncharacterized protein DUF6894